MATFKEKTANALENVGEFLDGVEERGSEYVPVIAFLTTIIALLVFGGKAALLGTGLAIVFGGFGLAAAVAAIALGSGLLSDVAWDMADYIDPVTAYVPSK